MSHQAGPKNFFFMLGEIQNDVARHYQEQRPRPPRGDNDVRHLGNALIGLGAGASAISFGVDALIETGQAGQAVSYGALCIAGLGVIVRQLR